MKNKKFILVIVVLLFLGAIFSVIDFKYGIRYNLYSQTPGSAIYKAASLPLTLALLTIFLIAYIIGKIKRNKIVLFYTVGAVLVIFIGMSITTFLLSLPYHQKECRQAKSWDEFKACYINKAKTIDPLICNGITYKETYFVVPPGRYRGLNALYARSQCFYEVSKSKNSIEYCKFVLNPYRKKCFNLDFSPFSLFNPSPLPTKEPAEESIEKPADEFADWLTYRNTEYGFEVRYPKEYSIRLGGGVNPGRFFFTKETDPYYGFDYSICVSDAQLNIEKQTREEILSVESPCNITFKSVRINNTDTLKVSYSRGDCSKKDTLWTQIKHNNNLYSIRWFMDYSVFSEDEMFKMDGYEKYNQILSIFKFTK